MIKKLDSRLNYTEGLDLLNTKDFNNNTNANNNPNNNINSINDMQQELANLLEDIKDLEQMLKINRDALKISLEPFVKNFSHNHSNNNTNHNSNNIDNPRFKHLPGINEITIPTSEYSVKEANKTLVTNIEQFYDDNTTLYIQMNQLIKECNLSHSKALISEQICEESQRRERETVKEMEDKVNELIKLLQEKEYIVHELEKVKLINEDEGIYLKYKEIKNPNDQTEKLQNELEVLTNLINKAYREITKLEQEKKDLNTINFVISKEISKLKATFSSPLNGFIKANTPARMVTGENIFKFPYIELENDESSSDSEIAPEMENKVVLNNKDINGGSCKATVPKLDLSKAKKIQEINAKKSSQQIQLVHNGIDPRLLEKLNMVEDELEGQKKLLSKEMITNKDLIEELRSSIAKHKSLLIQNKRLIKLNKLYEDKWQKTFSTYEFYKEFYDKSVHYVKPKSFMNEFDAQILPENTTETFEKLREKYNITTNRMPSKFMNNDLRMIEEAEDRIEDNSMFELDNMNNPYERYHTINEISDCYTNHMKLTKDECKNYLVNMAKELNLCMNNINANANTNNYDINDRIINMKNQSKGTITNFGNDIIFTNGRNIGNSGGGGGGGNNNNSISNSPIVGNVNNLNITNNPSNNQVSSINNIGSNSNISNNRKNNNSIGGNSNSNNSNIIHGNNNTFMNSKTIKKKGILQENQLINEKPGLYNVETINSPIMYMDEDEVDMIKYDDVKPLGNIENPKFHLCNKIQKLKMVKISHGDEDEDDNQEVEEEREQGREEDKIEPSYENRISADLEIQKLNQYKISNKKLSNMFLSQQPFKPTSY